MKRTLVVICMIVTLSLCLAACDSARIDVGVKDGITYFDDSTITPKIILKGENETEVDDESFFQKLKAAIQDKSTVEAICNCQAIYNISIDKYAFGLHTHGITVSSPMGWNIKGRNIFSVECSEEEMRELFSLLEKAEDM